MTVMNGFASKGTATSIASALTSAVSLFLVFRISIELYSASLIGCWALIQGIFLVARIADTGAGTNITRYLAGSRSAGTNISSLRLLVAALVITTLPVAALSVFLYFPTIWYVGSRYALEISNDQIAELTLLSAMVAVLSCTAAITMSMIEGFGRLDVRNYIVIFGNLVVVVVTYPVLREFGQIGLGLIYIIMNIVQLGLAIIALAIIAKRRDSAEVTLTEKKTVGSYVTVLWKENLKLSYMSLLRLSFEPITKLYLSFGASLESIAAFELALRVSTQVRTILQAASQPLLVMGSSAATDQSRRSKEPVFWKYNALIGVGTGLLIELQLLGSPLISDLGLGTVSAPFVIYFLFLSISNAINAIGLPGYFLQLSSGDLKPLTRIHVIMAATNLILGGLAALVAGPTAVVLAYCCSFAIGGVLCLRLLTGRAYGSRTPAHLREYWGGWIVPRLVIWGLAAFAISQLIDYKPGIVGLALAMAVILPLAAILIVSKKSQMTTILRSH